jgi:hypothetical protein
MSILFLWLLNLIGVWRGEMCSGLYGMVGFELGLKCDLDSSQGGQWVSQKDARQGIYMGVSTVTARNLE